ncbi:Spo7-like protein-domain-containing protein [Dipodascopsis uninucleata]
MDAIPSSPAQIYRNMLILEESLRNQYIEMKTRRLKYTLFCAGLILWTGYFYYGVFIWYSIYTYVHLFHQLCLTIGVVTSLLYYLSGMYSKTMVYPRKFLSNTNKGIRQFNMRLVVTESSATALIVRPSIRFLRVALFKFWYLKLVMLPKAFNTEFREGWELYRQEYWEKENERRAARASGRVLCACIASG